MRSTGDLNYVYRPQSEAHRRKLQEAHRIRLGNLPGHHRLYGVQVPDELFDEVKKVIGYVRKKNNIETTGWFTDFLVRNPEMVDPKLRWRLMLVMASALR